MMSKRTRRSHIALAFAGITAGFITLFGFTAQAASPHHHASDCERVAKADRKLCTQVQAQHSYGSYSGDQHAYWTVPSGRVIVHELTHDGRSKAEMRVTLVGYAQEYREYVTAVQVNMDAMVRKCGNTDGRWIVSYRDEDGKPGGTKLTYKRIVCA